MKDSFEKLDEVFNVSSEIVSEEQTKNPDNNLKVDSDFNDIKKDYEYTRGNLYSIIEKGQEAINGILEIAHESGQARSYEVAGQLIKNVADVAEKLINLQKTIKDIEDVKKSGPTNVTNALFVGSTAELSKLLKSRLNNTQDK